MQYLVAAYGPEKLNNPAEAEPIVKRMIEVDPSEYLNYLELAKIYENAGRYDEAEAQLLKARDVKPKQADNLRRPVGLLQPPGRVREDGRGAQHAPPTSSRRTPRATSSWRCSTGRRPSRTSA